MRTAGKSVMGVVPLYTARTNAVNWTIATISALGAAGGKLLRGLPPMFVDIVKGKGNVRTGRKGLVLVADGWS